MNSVELYALDLDKVVSYIANYITIPIPEQILTHEDMINAGKLLSTLTAKWSYLEELSMYGKVMVRRANREKKELKTKESTMSYEDMVDRAYIVQTGADILKQKYNTVSRMISTKQEINNEIKMGGGLYD